MGKTVSFPDHGAAYKFFNVQGQGLSLNERMCTQAADKGYDSIQFVQHVTFGGHITNYELVSTKLKGMYACASRTVMAQMEPENYLDDAIGAATWSDRKSCKRKAFFAPRSAKRDALFLHHTEIKW